MDRIEVLCDLRQGAVNDSLPFRSDPLKRWFHLGLMERGLLLATVLRVGERIASVHLDLRNGAEVLIYLIAHDPSLARDSPGSLHILMLAGELAKAGVSRYDLSPGGGYKDRFATERDVVHRMVVRFGLRGRLVGVVEAKALSIASAMLARSDRTPGNALAEARSALRRARRPFRRRRSLAMDGVPGNRTVVRLPSGSAVDPASVDEPVLVVDEIGDLLTFEPRSAPGSTRAAFLRRALHRLERGQHVLTRTENGKLAACWWAAALPAGSAPSAGDRPRCVLPEYAFLVYDDLPGVTSSNAGQAGWIVRALAGAVEAIEPGATACVAIREESLAAAVVLAGGTVLGEDMLDVSIREVLANSWPMEGPGA